MKLFSKSTRKLLGLTAFIATGGGLIISTAINEENLYKTEILIVVGFFFTISLIDHYRNLISQEIKTNKKSLYILICSFLGVTLTWFLNHEIGYGPVIANGLVGVLAGIFLPNDLAAITYTSSFVGMSSLAVIPSLAAATLASIIVCLVFLITAEIYLGIGGKGGTTAALSTIITKAITSFFS